MPRFVEDIANLRMADAEEAGGKAPTWGDGGGRPSGAAGVRGAARQLPRRHAGRAGWPTELNAAHRDAMLSVADQDRFTEMCEKMQALVLKAGMSDDVRERILSSYRTMGSNVIVAVRSSATGEDGADASFAGMNSTFTNISGEDELIDAVQRCWASLFRGPGGRLPGQPRVHRRPGDGGGGPADDRLERSGVAFTADPPPTPPTGWSWRCRSARAGGGVGIGRARHLRGVQGNRRDHLPPNRFQAVQDRPRRRRRDQNIDLSPAGRRPRCSTTTGAHHRRHRGAR